MVMQIKHLLLLLNICSIAVLILVERSSSTISNANTEADLKCCSWILFRTFERRHSLLSWKLTFSLQSPFSHSGAGQQKKI